MGIWCKFILSQINTVAGQLVAEFGAGLKHLLNLPTATKLQKPAFFMIQWLCNWPWDLFSLFILCEWRFSTVSYQNSLNSVTFCCPLWINSSQFTIHFPCTYKQMKYHNKAGYLFASSLKLEVCNLILKDNELGLGFVLYVRFWYCLKSTDTRYFCKPSGMDSSPTLQKSLKILWLNNLAALLEQFQT